MKAIIVIKLISITWILLYIISCKPSDSEPYYSFIETDFEFIPDNYQETGTILTFKNSMNDEIKMEVLFYIESKEYESGYGIGQPVQSESYYYDNLWIEIKLLDFFIDGQTDNFCNSIYLHITKNPNGLMTHLEIPIYEQPLCLVGGFQEYSPYLDLNVIEINGTEFSKVKILESDAYFSFFNGSQIDRLYYDFDYGIIGFDESENNVEYRLLIE